MRYHQHRGVDFVPHRINGVAEDQILQPAMAVRAHHHQIGMNLASQPHDRILGAAAVGDGELGLKAIGGRKS